MGLKSILFVWWFAVVTLQGGVMYYDYGNKETCEMMQRAKSREVAENKITQCQQTILKRERKLPHGDSAT